MIVTDEKFLALKRELLQKGVLEARIVSNSMWPLIKTDDLIRIIPQKEDLKKNQIIVFKFGNHLFCHLFIDYSKLEKGRLLTIGLNNDDIDFPIKEEDLLGIVSNYKLRLIDKIRLFFKS